MCLQFTVLMCCPYLQLHHVASTLCVGFWFLSQNSKFSLYEVFNFASFHQEKCSKFSLSSFGASFGFFLTERGLFTLKICGRNVPKAQEKFLGQDRKPHKQSYYSCTIEMLETSFLCHARYNAEQKTILRIRCQMTNLCEQSACGHVTPSLEMGTLFPFILPKPDLLLIET